MTRRDKSMLTCMKHVHVCADGVTQRHEQDCERSCTNYGTKTSRKLSNATVVFETPIIRPCIIMAYYGVVWRRCRLPLPRWQRRRAYEKTRHTHGHLLRIPEPRYTRAICTDERTPNDTLLYGDREHPKHCY